MTKMAAMSIYGKNLKKIFILRQGQIWSLTLLYGETGKTMGFIRNDGRL